ncbi:hypothetical protein ACQ4PT_031512 [Festuca glaucescens]
MDMILWHLSNTLERNLWSSKKTQVFTLAYLVNKSSILLFQTQNILILQETFGQFQKERDKLLAEVESLNADGQTHKVRDAKLQKLKVFEAHASELQHKAGSGIAQRNPYHSQQ